MAISLRLAEKTGLALLALLFFIWPYANTVSLRDLLLVLNLCVFGYLVWRQGATRQSLRDLILPAGILGLLTLWMYEVAFFVSPEAAWSLNEITSQWLRALVALIAGVLVALAVSRKNTGLKQQALLVVAIALLLHVLYIDLEALNIWLRGQDLERLGGLTGGPDKSNYLTNILFCFLLAEYFLRIIHKKKFLPVGEAILAAALTLTVISLFVERIRNGVAVLALLLLFIGTCYLIERRKRLKRLTLFAGFLLLCGIASAGLMLAATAKENTSLKLLVATIPIAWDTEQHKAWQDEQKYALPVLPGGAPVDLSAYQRIAWLKEGLLLVKEHPLGIGFGRNAFGHGLKAKYGVGLGHSHSGMLDLAIGTGVPGALLWLGFFVSLISLAWKRYRATPRYSAVLLLLLLLDFGIRMLLDSIIRDHMLQQFLFLAGLAAVMMTAELPAKRAAAS